MATDSIPNGITAPLRRLRHLTVDSHCSIAPPATPDIWLSLIQQTRLWGTSLRSITLKVTETLVIPESFVNDIVRVHKATLTHLALLNCTLKVESIRHLCIRCKELERFAISIPAKNRDIVRPDSTAKICMLITSTRSFHSQKHFLAQIASGR